MSIKKLGETFRFYTSMSCYKQLISIEKFDMITTLALTTTPNHKGFTARRMFDLSFVTEYIMHDKKRSRIWRLKAGSFLRHKTRK